MGVVVKGLGVWGGVWVFDCDLSSLPSMAAAPTMSPTVPVASGLPEFCPPAQNLIGAVVPAATGHAGRVFVDFKPEGRRARVSEQQDVNSAE